MYKSKEPPQPTCNLCHKMFEQWTRRRRCNACNATLRRIRMKTTAINMLGGKCVDCGFSGSIVAFDFHHPNPDKELNVATATRLSWAKVEKELRKCILLCATCHRLRHDHRREEYKEAAKEYSGTLYSKKELLA